LIIGSGIGRRAQGGKVLGYLASADPRTLGYQSNEEGSRISERVY